MNDQADGTKVTLATQKLRLAVAMSGGVSLAVWMGGVAREINLLTQASDLRDRGTGEPPVPRPGGPSHDSLALQVRGLYQRLLELVDVTASVDVLSGTSAGGINAAVLGLANARRLDLGPLRDLWLEAGAFGTLLRNPRREPNPPSLLQGDGQLLAGIRRGLGKLVVDAAGVTEEDARATTVHITTTLLHGENGRFTDDYGNAVVDLNNRGLFTFSQGHLVAPGIVDGLALAARSSASFPVAFEPSFVPIGERVKDKDEPAASMHGWHPDMARYANFTRPAWVVDGGLLANRPIGPLLRSVFARRADREVRRVLLFVVPLTGSPKPPPTADFTKPYGLGEALRFGLDAALEQSIAADLDAIRRHNDQVAAFANTRVLLARLASTKPLADKSTWDEYRSVQSTAVAATMVDEVTARMAAVDQWNKLMDTGGRASARIRAALTTAVERRITAPPQNTDDIVNLGLPAYDSARAVALDLIRAGYRLARRREDVEAIVHAHQRLNQFALTPADLTTVVVAALSEHAPKEPPADDSWKQVLASLAEDILERLHRGLKATRAYPPPGAGGSGPGGEGNTSEPLWSGDALMEAWSDLLGALTDVSTTLNVLAAGELRTATPEAVEDGAPSADTDMPASAAAATRGTPPKDTAGMRHGVAELIRDYLTFLGLGPAPGTGEVVRQPLQQRLIELHAAERTTSPIETDVEQRVQLVQVSAATRTLLDRDRADASDKLTGVQLHHFGAFYKGTWRANDWMWGRLDAAGWLVQILLDPRRISAIIDARQEAGEGPAEGGRARWFYNELRKIVGAPRQAEAFNISEESLLEELEFLDKPETPVPPSLQDVALWAALPLQRLIAAEELAAVAGQIRDPANGGPSSDARRWLGQYDMALTGRPSIDATSIYDRLVDAEVPKRKRISTFLGTIEALLGDKAPAAVREELRFLRKDDPDFPASLPELHGWITGKSSPSADGAAPADGAPPADGAWVNRVAATLPGCPIPGERLPGEVGTPLFTRTVTQTLAVATAAGTTTKRKPPASLAPAISTARTATTSAYVATRQTNGDGKRLVWLGLLALGIGIASMFVSVPLVGAAGLVVVLAGAILLGVGLWRGSIRAAALVVALAVILIAAAPWLPFLRERLFSWLEQTALPLMERHPWIWTAVFLLVLLPPAWKVAEWIAPRLRRRGDQVLLRVRMVRAGRSQEQPSTVEGGRTQPPLPTG